MFHDPSKFRMLARCGQLISLSVLIVLGSSVIPTLGQTESAPQTEQPSGATAPVTASPVEAATSDAPAAAPKKPAPPVEVPIELKPYRVDVLVAFEDDMSLPTAARQELLVRLGDWVDRTYAEMWQVAIQESSSLRPANPEGLSRLNAALIESQASGPETDKVFLLTVSARGVGWLVAGREWDRLTGQLSTTAERVVADRRALANELGVVLRDLFHPLVLIEGTEGKSVARVRIRAGDFPPGDPTAEQWSKGAFFQPVFRSYGKNHEVTRIQMVPWTYVQAESFDRGIGTGSIHSGLSIALGKNSKRMENWAIGVKPTFPHTRLRITPHNNPTKPLTGYQVNVYERQMVMPAEPPASEKPATAANNAAAAKPANGEENQSPDAQPAPPAAPQPVAQFVKLFELTTDRRGTVTIPRDPDRSLVWLYVSSGGSMLGRFPYLPGSVPSYNAELTDDSLRLQIESRLELLRSEFIDTVARRALLIARAKGAAKNAKWPVFDEAFAELDKQPTAKYFHTLLDAIKASSLKQATGAQAKFLQKRVDKLCKESADLIERHLSAEKVDSVRSELVELKKLDEEAAEDANRPRQVVPGRQSVQ